MVFIRRKQINQSTIPPQIWSYAFVLKKVESVILTQTLAGGTIIYKMDISSFYTCTLSTTFSCLHFSLFLISHYSFWTQYLFKLFYANYYPYLVLTLHVITLKMNLYFLHRKSMLFCYSWRIVHPHQHLKKLSPFVIQYIPSIFQAANEFLLGVFHHCFTHLLCLKDHPYELSFPF